MIYSMIYVRVIKCFHDIFDKKLETFDELYLITSSIIATDKSIISHYYNTSSEPVRIKCIFISERLLF